MPNREYYLKNKDSLTVYAKKYYQEHKNENPSFVKIECSLCKGSYCLMNIKQHLRTKKHQMKEMERTIQELKMTSVMPSGE